MLRVDRTVLVLLAAGRSERFGDIASKLDQDFLGRPLGLHVAVALEDVPFMERLAIVNRATLDYSRHRFTVLANPEHDAGIASSVQIGVRRAQELKADAVLIALADMPRLTAAHIHRLFDATENEDSVVASSDGENPTPPAIFGRGQFGCLLDLAGDTGARELVRGGRHVITNPAELIDVDTAEDLDRLRALVKSHDPGVHPETQRAG